MEKAFLNDIRRGLGRAYLTLKKAPDKNVYFETLSYACLTDSAYDYIFEGSKGEYLFRLINLFEKTRAEEIKKRIIASLSPKDKTGLIFQKLEILRCFYLDGDLTVAQELMKFYDSFKTETKAWTIKRLSSFEILLVEIDRILGIKKTKEAIAFILAKKFDLNNFLWYQLLLKDRYKNKFILDFANMKGRSTKSRFICESAEDFLKLAEKPANRLFFVPKDQNDFNILLTELKNCDNVNVIKATLKIFADKFSEYRLPPDILFDLIEKFGDKVREEVYQILQYYKSDKVKETGLELIKTRKYLTNGLVMLFTNYNSDLKDVIIKSYKKVRFTFNGYFVGFNYDTVDFMNHKKSGYPDDILITNYYNNFDSSLREKIIKVMKKRKLITKEIAKECKFDSNNAVIKLAEKL